MGKFADNVAPAAKLVVATLPKVTIMGVVCHVPTTNFEDALAFSSSLAKASEFLDVNAKTDLSGGMTYMLAAQILIGESLLDEGGNPVLSDKADMKAFLKVIYDDAELREKLEVASGWKDRIENLKAAPKSELLEPTNEEKQEAALGNSKPPLQPE